MGRKIDLPALLASLEQSDDDRVYMKVGVFDVRLVLTDEGIVVDIFPHAETGQFDCLATTYAFDADALPEDEFEGHSADCEIRLSDAGICTCHAGL